MLLIIFYFSISKAFTRIICMVSKIFAEVNPTTVKFSDMVNLTLNDP